MNLTSPYIEVFVIRQIDLSPFTPAPSPLKNAFPIYSQDAYSKRIDLSNHNIKNTSQTYFIELDNNPFTITGPRKGSILIVEKDKGPKSGQIIIAWLEGEFVVRKYLLKNVYPRLVCENPDIPDVEIEPDMEFSVWGVVVGVIRQRRNMI